MSRPRSAAGCEVRIGILTGWDASGPMVDFEGNSRGPVRARVSTSVGAPPPGAAFEPGREVVLLVDPRPDKPPVVVGLLQPLDSPMGASQVEARIDGRRVELEGRDEVVLRCGEASITLRSNGRVSIRGVQVETRARGLNRIKGGSVAIN